MVKKNEGGRILKKATELTVWELNLRLKTQ